MKAIENRIIKTIGQSWAFACKGIQWVSLSKRDMVHLDHDKDQIVVWLWNTDICRINTDTGKVYLFDGGYRTVTTKSRLNAILAHYGQPRITQRNFDWYIGDNKAWTGGYSFTIGQ